ncbi:venom allergen 5-like [Panulirus ornatus]|uniref:venom allergen 5-like n=1 Tax=Panulirus ornatus TaxID=150431 RepID=UPI003A8A98BA
MARRGVRSWWLTEVACLGTLLGGCWPLITSPAAMATSVGHASLLEQQGRDFDGVFPCPCGWDSCRSPATQGLGAETYAFSSTCFLPADHSASPSRSSVSNSSRSAAVTAAAGRDYCSFTSQHSLCRYSADKAGQACGQVLTMGVGSQGKAEAVRVHNELRARVAGGREARGRPGPQPPAADMMMLEWDEELGRIAQAWANQCVFQHDCGDCRRTERFVVGQNLFISGGTGGAATPDWRAALTAF